MFKSLILVMFISAATLATNISLNENNVINMRGEVNDESVQAWQTELARKSAARRVVSLQPLYLAIDSPGGSITAGLSFIEYAKTIPNLHTITLFGASMASAIQQALPGKRYVLATSVTMYHRAAGGFQGQFSEGEVESRLNMAKDLVSILETVNAARMKMPLETYKQLVKDEYWLVGSKNTLKNAADELVTVTCTPELINSSTIQHYENAFFSISVRFSNCPLFRGAELVKGQEAYQKHKAEIHKKLTGIYSMGVIK